MGEVNIKIVNIVNNRQNRRESIVEKWQAVFAKQQEVSHWVAYIFLLVQALFVPAYVDAEKFLLSLTIAMAAFLHGVLWLVIGIRTFLRTSKIHKKVSGAEEKIASEFRIYAELADPNSWPRSLFKELTLLNLFLPGIWILFWIIIGILHLPKL